MMAHLLCYLDPPSTHQLNKTTTKKKNVKIGPLWENFLDLRMLPAKQKQPKQ